MLLCPVISMHMGQAGDAGVVVGELALSTDQPVNGRPRVDPWPQIPAPAIHGLSNSLLGLKDALDWLLTEQPVNRRPCVDPWRQSPACFLLSWSRTNHRLPNTLFAFAVLGEAIRWLSMSIRASLRETEHRRH